MKKPVLVTLCIVLILFGLYLSLRDDADRETSELGTAEVKQGRIEAKLSELGVIEPWQQVAIKSKIGGEIVQFSAFEGQTIKAGDLLVKIDSAAIRNDLNQSLKALAAAEADHLRFLKGPQTQEISVREAAYRAAVARRQQAQQVYERGWELFQQQILSRQEIDNLLTNLDIAKAESDSALAGWELLKEGYRQEDISVAQARVDELRVAYDYNKKRLKDATITSPINGVVIEKNAEAGEIISAGTVGSKEGTLLLTVADLTRLIVRSAINEVNINQVELGQQVRIHVDAAPDKSYRGEIFKIAQNGRRENNVVTYEVLVKLQKAGEYLKPGMTAQIDIVTASRDQALLVPIEAVSVENKMSLVLRKKGSVFVKQEVSTGISNGMQIEVLSGLSESDLIGLPQ